MIQLSKDRTAFKKCIVTAHSRANCVNSIYLQDAMPNMQILGISVSFSDADGSFKLSQGSVWA